MNSIKLPLLLSLGMAGASMQVHAAENYNQVSFGVEVVKNVANDELTATLTKSTDHANAKTLANTLNTTTNKALSIAQKYPNVKVTTGRHHTYPRYDNKGKINGFTGSSSVNVQSQNFEEASELIAELQQFMTLENLNFSVSESTQKSVENELKTQTIQKFSTEAKEISHAFGVSDYKLVRVDLNNTYGGIQVRPMMMKDYAVAEAASSPIPQAYEGGESRLTYSAQGVIELINR